MSKDQQKISAQDISQEVYNLFDEHVHSAMGRREFMNQLKNPPSLCKECIVILSHFCPNVLIGTNYCVYALQLTLNSCMGEF